MNSNVVGDKHPDKPGWTWQRRVCTVGTCYHAWEGWLPADQTEARAELAAGLAEHVAAAHPEQMVAAIDAGERELGGSSPTSWPPGALPADRVDPSRVVETHPDGSVATTKPVLKSADGRTIEGHEEVAGLAPTAPDGSPNPDPGAESPTAATAPDADPTPRDPTPPAPEPAAKHEPEHHGRGKRHR